jgi:predicted amidohydrolase
MKQTATAKNCTLCGSLIITENNNYYNRLIWMKPGGNYLTYDKRHLFRLAEEQKTYTAGTKKIIPEIKGWKILPLVCYDLRFPVWSRRTEKENYDLLLYVANWPDRRIKAWNTLLPARAVENQCYVAGLNRTATMAMPFPIPATPLPTIPPATPSGNPIPQPNASKPLPSAPKRCKSTGGCFPLIGMPMVSTSVTEARF